VVVVVVAVAAKNFSVTDADGDVVFVLKIK
jgi:hypothetical protein